MLYPSAAPGPPNAPRPDDEILEADALVVASPAELVDRHDVIVVLTHRWHASPGFLGTLIYTSILPLLLLFGCLALAAHRIAAGLGRRLHHLLQRTMNLAHGAGRDTLGRDTRHGDPFFNLTAVLNAVDRQITGRIRTLTQKKQQWEDLFTNMREGFVAVNGDMQIITINRAALRFLCIPEETPPVDKLLPEAIRNADLIEFINKLLAGGEPFLEDRMTVHLQDNTRIELRLSGVRFQQDSERSVLVVLHDITQLKRLENMRRSFVANVSHELKTPLTAINGFLMPLEDSIAEDAPDQARHFIEVIGRHARRMNAIIDDLLALSELEQTGARTRLDFEPHLLGDCVGQAIGICRERAVQHDVTITADVPEIRLKMKRRLLEQAVANLLDNAIKYSPAGATATVTCKQTADWVMLQVRDQGVGIPCDHHEHIFERFYRVDKSRDRKTGGTGLGLSIVKHIAVLHSGKVTVTSKVDQDVLGKALKLDVFGVIDKPVKMHILHQLLDRLFVKKYNSSLFAR